MLGAHWEDAHRPAKAEGPERAGLRVAEAHAATGLLQGLLFQRCQTAISSSDAGPKAPGNRDGLGTNQARALRSSSRATRGGELPEPMKHASRSGRFRRATERPGDRSPSTGKLPQLGITTPRDFRCCKPHQLANGAIDPPPGAIPSVRRECRTKPARKAGCKESIRRPEHKASPQRTSTTSDGCPATITARLDQPEATAAKRHHRCSPHLGARCPARPWAAIQGVACRSDRRHLQIEKPVRNETS